MKASTRMETAWMVLFAFKTAVVLVWVYIVGRGLIEAWF